MDSRPAIPIVTDECAVWGELSKVHLSIDGMGIVFFSAEIMKYIAPGTDFLTTEFTQPYQIAEHIKKGDITAFCTGSGGDFNIHFLSGYPSADVKEPLI